MAYDKVTRSFRQGTVKLIDGVPRTITIVADEGDLNWTETKDVKEIIYRGDPTNAASHPMTGNTMPSDVTFTCRVTELLGAAGNNDDCGPYRFLTNQDSNVTSVGLDGEAFQLKVQFDLADPGAPTTGERVTFEEFILTGLAFQEGDDYSTLAVTGRNFKGAPALTTY